MCDNAYRFYGHKTKDKAAFNVLFGTLMREAIKEGNMYNVYDKLEQIELKEPITMDFIKEFCSQGGYDFQLPKGVTLSGDIDWSDSKEVFYYLSFDENTFADTPREHLPQGYDPQQVFEKGKSIGLGIDEVHDMGYTGKGVGVAICDWQLKPHSDLSIKEYQCAEYASKVEDYFHASAVTGILAGKQTGVAPDSDVYFFAEYQDRSETGGNDMINTLHSIIEKNKSLPDSQKIRVVSISGPIYGEQEEAQALVKELTDSGVWVLSADAFWDEEPGFGYLEKKDPMGDVNDFSNYQINNPNDDKHPERGLYVTSGNRTVPDPTNKTAYRHDSRASASWAIPVLAGYYALACQADPNMTPQRFKQLAAETARVQESTTFKKGVDPFEGRTEGLFVIESKNYSGWIFGNERNKQWTQTLPAGRWGCHKEHFYNPIMQNGTHIRAIRKYIDDTIPVYSVIAFSDDCIFKDVTVKSNVIVTHYSNLYSAINSKLSEISYFSMTAEQFENIYNSLRIFADVDSYTKLKHIQDIR